jgi:DNA-binding MarR family transcriptional regulator
MPPVKHKNTRHKTAPPRKSPPIASPVTPPVAARADVSPSGEAGALVPAASAPTAAATPTEVADQLHSAAIHLLRRLRVRDRETNIGPAQLSALSVLVFGGPKSLGELAGAEQVRPPTMSRIVASLQRSGLVRRHPTEDGRRVRLEATPKGVSLMWEARKRRVESLANAVAGLPENKRQQLGEAIILLQQVMRNL